MCASVYILFYFVGTRDSELYGTWKIEGALILLHECMFEV